MTYNGIQDVAMLISQRQAYFHVKVCFLWEAAAQRLGPCALVFVVRDIFAYLPLFLRGT